MQLTEALYYISGISGLKTPFWVHLGGIIQQCSGVAPKSTLRTNTWQCSGDHMDAGDQTTCKVSHMQGKHQSTVLSRKLLYTRKLLYQLKTCFGFHPQTCSSPKTCLTLMIYPKESSKKLPFLCDPTCKVRKDDWILTNESVLICTHICCSRPPVKTMSLESCIVASRKRHHSKIMPVLLGIKHSVMCLVRVIFLIRLSKKLIPIQHCKK